MYHGASAISFCVSHIRIISTLAGIDHLLPNGRGAGGSRGEESDELHVACFMGLLSFLASQPEVMRVSAARKVRLLNAAAFPNIQSATSTETPLSDSGLDGTGEVIQVGESAPNDTRVGSQLPRTG